MTTYDDAIFKAYDIRGLYPEQINESVAALIGRAYIHLTGATKVVVGRDMRTSSPSMAEGLITGILDAGADVVDIGQVSSPMMYFGVGYDESINGGIIVTASHNPAGYSGLKLVRSDVTPIGLGTGMDELKQLVAQNKFQDAKTRGSLEFRDIFEEYRSKIFSLVDLSAIKKMTVAVDCGNGINGPIIKEIMREIEQVDTIEMYYEPDGTFPNHEANPLKEETLEDLKTRVIMKNAAIGFAYDGDADRLGVVDELGHAIPGDVLTALIGNFLLKKYEGDAQRIIFHDQRSMWIIKDLISKAGGEARPSKAGHSFFKINLKNTQALFGGELSGHFFYHDFFNAESADLTMLLMMQMLSESGKTMSELVDPLRKYFYSGEINFEVKDKDAAMKSMEQKYLDNAINIDWMDGLTVEHADFRFNLRPSNTESLLRLNIEGRNQEVVTKVRDEMVEALK